MVKNRVGQIFGNWEVLAYSHKGKKDHRGGFYHFWECKNIITSEAKLLSTQRLLHIQWQKDNPERIKEYSIRYKQSHKEYLKNYRKEYYKKNKEKINQQILQYYYRDKEKWAERARKYYEKNIERLREYGRQQQKWYSKKYYQEHRYELNEYNKKWYREHSDKVKEYNKRQKQKYKVSKLIQKNKDKIAEIVNLVDTNLIESFINNLEGEQNVQTN